MLTSSSFSCALQTVVWCIHPKQLAFSSSRRKDGAGCKHLIDSSDQAKENQKKTPHNQNPTTTTKAQPLLQNKYALAGFQWVQNLYF